MGNSQLSKHRSIFAVKFHYVKETHMMLVTFWQTLVKVFAVSQHKRQRNKSLSRLICQQSENTESDLKVHALHYANELLVHVRLAFLKLLQTRKRAETTRNYQKQVLVMIKHCLGNSQVNSIPE